MSDYLYDRSGTDDDIAQLEQTLGAYAHHEPLRETSLHPRNRRRVLLGGAVFAAVAAAVIALVVMRRPIDDHPCDDPVAGMAFSSTQGSTRCGGRVAASGTLPVGTWLETDANSSARMKVATIGDLTMSGNTRLRIVETSTRTHRLELASGHISARVTAPPRLFVVDTPAATAVDLGCAYELTVDEHGATRLVVTSGAVSLEGTHGTALVLHGMEVGAARGVPVGTPLAVATSPAMRAAVSRLDAGDQSAVTAIVEHAGEPDIVTLWQLIARVDASVREPVVRRLAELVPIPFDYELADMIAAKPEALDAWREDVEWEWLLR